MCRSPRRWLALGALGLCAAACGPAHQTHGAAPAHAPDDATSGGTPLGAGDVATVVNGAHDRFQGCLFLASSPESHGRIKVSFSVAPSGSVEEAHLDSASFPDKPVVHCVVKEMQKLQFPAATAETSASWTFAFQHAGAH